MLIRLPRPPQQRGGDGEAEGVGGFQVNDQLELRRLLDGEVGGPGTPENLVDVHSSARGDILEVRAVRHYAAYLDVFAPLVGRGVRIWAIRSASPRPSRSASARPAPRPPPPASSPADRRLPAPGPAPPRRG